MALLVLKQSSAPTLSGSLEDDSERLNLPMSLPSFPKTFSITDMEMLIVMADGGWIDFDREIRLTY